MPLPTKKRTRKPHKDKDIEAVLLLKDKWNLQASQFIYDLIAFKRGLNGRGDAEHRLPPSRVTDKLDASIATLLNRLTGQYRDLAQNGLAIVKKQDELNQKKSEKKRKGPDSGESKSEPSMSLFQSLVGEPPASSNNTPPPANLPRTSHDTSYNLISEATNPFTRALYKIRGPLSKQPGRRTLEGMLFTFLDARNETEEMQDASVSTGSEDEKRLQASFESFRKTVSILNSLYQQYLTDIGQTTEDISNKESGYQSQFDFYKREFLVADSIMGTSHTFKSRFNNLAKAFEQSQNDIDRADILTKIRSLYQELTQYYKSNFSLKQEKPWNTISDLFTLGPTPLPPESILNFSFNLQDDKIQALAHNIFTRFVKKKKLQLVPTSDRFVGTKLKLFDVLSKCRDTLTSAMNTIEAGGDHRAIGEHLKAIKSYFDEIRRLLNTMNAGKEK